MTTTTPDTVALPTADTRGPSSRVRFLVAFAVGLVLALVVGVGALYAYDQQFAGRVLPGVRIGTVDLSGLDAATAAQQLQTAYTALGEGTVKITTTVGERSFSYADIGRGPDVEAMVAEALAVGRGGTLIDRFIANTRTAVRGATITPMVTYDPQALADRIVGYAD